MITRFGLRSLLFIIPSVVVSVSLTAGDRPQTQTVDDETCLTCHEEVAVTLARTSHRLASATASPASTVSCSGCHSGGEVHIEDPSSANITNPSRLAGDQERAICSACHTPHRTLDNLGFDPHSTQQLNCSACHRVHGGQAALLLDEGTPFCARCHHEQDAKFSRRSNHPVKQGILSCLSCHRFTKGQDAGLRYDLDRVCQDCHPDQGGPFPFEHAANSALPIDGTGCVGCHDPHGSENDFLLKQDSQQICRSCHAGHVTRNHGNLWNEVWSQYSCQTCHTDLHGSYANALYLDPDLEVKFDGDCFTAGCHDGDAAGGVR